MGPRVIYGPGIDEPICLIVSSGANAGTYFYHFDGLGSVIALSNMNGNIVEAYSYDVFGTPTIYTAAGSDGLWRTSDDTTATASAVGNPYLFTGRRWDGETGLYYYRVRMYSPALGRFLQPDPIGYADSMNLYTYCGNDPLNFIDPWGLCKGKENLSFWDRYKIWSLTNLANAIDWWYNASGGKEMERFYWEGKHVGTQIGNQSVDWYAQRYLESDTWYGKAGYYTGGLFASLWTKENWKITATTIAVAGAVAKPASEHGPWLGKAAIHGAHSGGPHQYRHIQIMIRIGKHVTKHFRIPLPF